MHVTALTHRANPIYPAMIAGPLPNEASLIETSLARIVQPLVRPAIAGLADYDLPQSGGGRHHAVLAIRKSYAGQARQTALMAWACRSSSPPNCSSSSIKRFDVRDAWQVQRAVAANVNPARDVFFHQGPPDPFDPAALPGALGTRMALDATEKLPGEHAGDWPAAADVGQAVRRAVGERWSQYGLGPEPQE